MRNRPNNLGGGAFAPASRCICQICRESSIPRNRKNARRGQTRDPHKFPLHPGGPLSIPVRCACGKRYNAKPAHAGRSIRCRCGRIVPIPASAPGRRRWPLVTASPAVSRIFTALTWAYLAAAFAAALFLWLLGDRWWLATVLLFGPRWPLLLPAFPLLLGALAIRPRLAIPATLAALIVLGPVMGFNFGWRRLLSPGGPRELRLITFNVEGSRNTGIASVPLALDRYDADIVAFQECPARLTAADLWPAGWATRIEGDICLASRFPILAARVEDRVRTGAQGGTGTVVLFRLGTPSDSFDVAVVHLETPRKGLEPLRYGGSVRSMKLNILVRDAGSSKSSRWIAEQSSDAIITGDFNLPVESRIFRAHWSRCPDAFTTAGRGFGWTRALKRFSARIDHVLTCGSWRALHAEIGPELGSDHLPLIVDLARRR